MTSALPGALRRVPDLGLRLSHESRLTRRLPRNQRKSLIDSTVLLGGTGLLSGTGRVGGTGHVGSTGHFRHRGLPVAVSHPGRPV
ncbi:hypothetical protein ACFRCW_04430 [Streptomyces sp. NPDC056653]|uniref:hypothetical protein n=1 Tax=Streptomyces sp. NPDC056653 TaxID=3345894 RepID=UPI0036ABBEBF